MECLERETKDLKQIWICNGSGKALKSLLQISILTHRFYGDGLRNPLRRATKRSEEGPHVQDFNSVPFMGILHLIFEYLNKAYLLQARDLRREVMLVWDQVELWSEDQGKENLLTIKNIPSKFYINDFTDILFSIMRKREQKKRMLISIHGPCWAWRTLEE